MAFNHVAVRNLINPILDPHREVLTKDAREGAWKYWLGDMPVTAQLHEYGTALQKAYPFLKFWASSKKQLTTYATTDSGVGISVFVETYVCMDSSHYAVAKIGFNQYREKQDSARLYMVSARGIENEKYHTGRSQYHMKLTSNLKVAIKNALSNLVPYTALEIAHVEYDPIHDKSVNAGKDKASRLPTLLGAVTHSVLLNEVRALYASGATFITPEFQAVVDNMAEAVQLANVERSKRVDMVLVSFVERNGGMMVDCAEVHNVRSNYWAKGAEEQSTYALADLPQPIVEKVSVLQGLDSGSFVDGIGMKLDEKLFWVEK